MSARAALVACILCACGGPVPSMTPLGEGPLSRVHASLRRDAAKPDDGPRAALAPPSRDRDEDPTDSKSTNEEESDDDRETKTEEPQEDEAAAAGEKSESEKATATAWEGEYAGEDLATYRFDDAPDRLQRDPNATTRVARESGKLRLTIVDSSNGTDLCTLSAKQDGATASIDAGQECFSGQDGIVHTRGVVSSGTAKIRNDLLVLEAELDFELRAADRTRKGRLSYRFEGKRK